MASQRNGGIAWCDETWNPTRGCSRVSEGCRNCYAERIAARFSKQHYDYESEAHGYRPAHADAFHGFAEMTPSGPLWTGKVELIPEKLDEPLHWKKPQRVFVNSMSDLFHESLPDDAIDSVWGVMLKAPQHTFQILTKRPRRMAEYFRVVIEEGLHRFGREYSYLPIPNVWLGVSFENQATADERIPLLLQTPAAVRFVSYEPALGPVNFTPYLLREFVAGKEIHHPTTGTIGGTPWSSAQLTPGLDWVIIGGESGPGARPFNLEWARSVIGQCKAAGVACFYKQGGSSNRCAHDSKGGHFECFPGGLQIREFPK